MSFVRGAGIDFEKRILENEVNNVKFKFLKIDDPYYAYYKHKVAEFQGGGEDAKANTPEDTRKDAVPQNSTIEVPGQVTLPIEKKFEVPEGEHYTAHVPEGLAMMDVDVVKLTAQFVARNGKSFLTGLASREHANPRFNFLKPTHSLFCFFAGLCDAYSRVLMPPKSVVASLRTDTRSISHPLERAFHRLEYERMKSLKEKKEVEAAKEEQQAMQSIDWHEFEVVETIDFNDGEESSLPEPITVVDSMHLARSAQYGESFQSFNSVGGLLERSVDTEELNLVKESGAVKEDDTGMELSDDEEQPIKIVKHYRRPDPQALVKGAHDSTKFVVSPFSGELVPIEKMGEHMRVSLIDPQWKNQRETMLAKIKETTKASDDEISRNLALLAKTRPDIFGGGTEAMTLAVERQIDLEKSTGRNQAQNAKRQRT